MIGIWPHWFFIKTLFWDNNNFLAGRRISWGVIVFFRTRSFIARIRETGPRSRDHKIFSLEGAKIMLDYLYSCGQRGCLLMWTQYQFCVSVEEAVWKCWLVQRLFENQANCLVGREFFFYLWINFLWECVVAVFLYRRVRIFWSQICFCWKLYWLDLSGDEIEKCSKNCHEKTDQCLFCPENLTKLFLRPKMFSFNFEIVFWQTLTVCNSKSLQKEMIRGLEVKVIEISISSKHNIGIAFIPTNRF